ncbi:MAG: hypothetical protein ABIA91_00625 [Patescibacteria group bacterium]
MAHKYEGKDLFGIKEKLNESLRLEKEKGFNTNDVVGNSEFLNDAKKIKEALKHLNQAIETTQKDLRGLYEVLKRSVTDPGKKIAQEAILKLTKRLERLLKIKSEEDKIKQKIKELKQADYYFLQKIIQKISREEEPEA